MAGSPQAALQDKLTELYASQLPWNVSNPSELGPAIVQFYREQEPFYRRWAQKWFENVQFIYGNQSIKWSQRWGVPIDVDFLRRVPTLQQRAQTNLARVVTESIASMLFGNVPVWDVEAGSESSTKGRQFRRVVQKFLDGMMERLVMRKDFQQAAMIMAAYGQVGAEINHKANQGSILEIPRFQKVKKPILLDYMATNPVTGGLLEVPTTAMDSMGQPMFEEIWEPVMDQMGRQIIDKMFSGQTMIDILTPFEYRRQTGSYGFHRTKHAARLKIMDYDEFLDEYNALEGKTKEFLNVRPMNTASSYYDMAMRHYMLLRWITPPVLDQKYRQLNSYGPNSLRQKVFVVDHYDAPNLRKFPTGRRVVVANGVCTHITVPGYNTNKLDGWHPFAEAQWMAVAPNSVATGPLNDAIQKNRELNVKDSLQATAVRRNMGSQLLTKVGNGIVPENITGEPGSVHEVSDPFAVRWLHDDIPIPPIMAQLRAADKEDIYEVSAVMDAMRGAPSSGSTSGYQEKQREEREQKRVYPYREEFEAFVSTIGEKLFHSTRANMREIDPYVMGYMVRSGAGEIKPKDVISVLTQPIDYGIDIKVRKSSMAVKSKASFQALLQELAQGPAGQRIAQDARVLDAYLKEFDVEIFRDASAVHRDRAEKENEAWMDIARLGPNAEGIGWPTVLFEDDDDIHMAYHQEYLLQNADEIQGNEMMMRQILMHIEWHRLQKQEKAATVPPGTALQTPMMYRAAQGAPAPQPAQIAQGAQQIKQTQAQSQQAPQAPTQATGGPNGQKATDPNAPSGNTPKATVSGGKAQ